MTLMLGLLETNKTMKLSMLDVISIEAFIETFYPGVAVDRLIFIITTKVRRVV